MNSLKRHLSLIIPLLALLFGLESIMLVNRAISTHEQKLAESYSVVIVSKEELTLDKIQTFVRDAGELKRISAQQLTQQLNSELREQFGKDTLESLQKELPNFYSVRLETFPDDEKLAKIKSTLSKLNGVTQVETFSKSHSQVYRLLLIIKSSVVIFSVLTAILSCLLMVKQIEVWRLEHSERMEIMSFLGAPGIMRNSVLFKLAAIDSVIAALISFTALVYFKDSPQALEIASALEVSNTIMNVALDGVTLLGCAFAVSLVSVFFVIIKQKDL